MVEGHSVHRVAHRHRTNLVGGKFKATSPNGRFSAGAAMITTLTFAAIEAVGKNLFAFFGDMSSPHVVHVHFGMSGAWSIHPLSSAPPPTPTTRLRLEGPDNSGNPVVVDLSAMTCNYGDISLYNEKRAKLGEDPLRADVNPERLWGKVSASKKPIGALLMDQSYFTGPGNIYRAEILLKAGVHPEVKGIDLTRTKFDSIWYHTVDLLRRGYESGSIITVDEEDQKRKPGLRRYIYNSSKCGKCGGRVESWNMAGRTCYACQNCQSREGKGKGDDVVKEEGEKKKVHEPFNSHCAKDDVGTRLERGGAKILTIPEIRNVLSTTYGVFPSRGVKKSELVEMLNGLRAPKVNAFDAAREKVSAGEARNVEHVAELSAVQAKDVKGEMKEGLRTPKGKIRKPLNVKPERKKRKLEGN